MYNKNATVVLTIPGIPASKKNSMIVVGKRLIKDKSVRNYEALVETIAAVEMSRLGLEPLKGPCAIEITCFFPTCHRRDVHNVFGSICDALQEHVYLDDHQLVTVKAEKYFCPDEHPRTVVQVWELEDDAAYPLVSCQKAAKKAIKMKVDNLKRAFPKCPLREIKGLDGKTD